MSILGHEGHDEEIIDPLRKLAIEMESQGMQPTDVALRIHQILGRMSSADSVRLINRVDGISDPVRKKLKDSLILAAMFDAGAMPADVKNLAKKKPNSPSQN